MYSSVDSASHPTRGDGTATVRAIAQSNVCLCSCKASAPGTPTKKRPVEDHVQWHLCLRAGLYRVTSSHEAVVRAELVMEGRGAGRIRIYTMHPCDRYLRLLWLMQRRNWQRYGYLRNSTGPASALSASPSCAAGLLAGGAASGAKSPPSELWPHLPTPSALFGRRRPRCARSEGRSACAHAGSTQQSGTWKHQTNAVGGVARALSASASTLRPIGPPARTMVNIAVVTSARDVTGSASSSVYRTARLASKTAQACGMVPCFSSKCDMRRASRLCLYTSQGLHYTRARCDRTPRTTHHTT